MKRYQSLWRRIVAGLLAVMLLSTLSTAVSAKSLSELIHDAVVRITDEDVNHSYLSEDTILLGESVTIFADAREVDTKTCSYAYYVRISGLFWTTLQSFGSKTSCTYTPKIAGEYEICVKIRSGLRIFKKYMNLKVVRELKLQASLGSSFLEKGDRVTLTAKAEGGEGALSYGFYYKPANSEEWTALSPYGKATSVTWCPKYADIYDICIKVKDQGKQVKKEYYTLTVSEELSRTPEEFTITVKSPIASPYFWKCSSSEPGILDWVVTEKTARTEDYRPMVELTYHFRTKALGRTVLTFCYDMHNGKEYRLNYDITVDRNHNWHLTEQEGTYFEPEQPEPETVTGSFVVRVPKAEIGYRWKCDIGNSLVAELAERETDDDDYEVFSFRTLREGYVTVTLICASTSEMKDRYRLIYNLQADEHRVVSLRDACGYYEEGVDFPEVEPGVEAGGDF